MAFGLFITVTCSKWLRWTVVCLLIASFAEADDLLNRCPSNLERTKYLKATEWEMCYEFHAEERTWKGASVICTSRGGRLVTIREKRIQDFLISSLYQYKWPRNGLWLGATDKAKEMEWRWVTGERVSAGFRNWARGQPSCGFFCFEDCAVMRWKESGRWHDYRCNWVEDYSFICEYEMVPVPTTTTTAAPTTTTTKEASTTTTTTTTTTTPPSTTTTPLPTTKALESDNLLKAEDESQNEPNVSVPVIVLAVNSEPESHVDEEKNVSSSLSTSSLAGLILGLIVGLSVGSCFLFFFVMRRRRRKEEVENDAGMSYSNPYYGEINAPLTVKPANGNIDCSSQCLGATGATVAPACQEKEKRLKLPPPPSPLHNQPRYVMNTYDTPPTLKAKEVGNNSKKGKGEAISTKDYVSIPAEEENYYDDIPPQYPGHDDTYDVPRASKCQQYYHTNDEENDYEGEENIYLNVDENLYESMETVRAAAEQRRLQSQDTNGDSDEQDRYVPFPLDLPKYA